MPRRYPVELRRKVLDLIEAGMPLTEIVVQLGPYRAARDLGDIEAVASGNPSRVGKRMARKAVYRSTGRPPR